MKSFLTDLFLFGLLLVGTGIVKLPEVDFGNFNFPNIDINLPFITKSVIEIDKPSDEVVEQTIAAANGVSSSIKKDMAIFCDEFSKRIRSLKGQYVTSAQIYEEFFPSSFKEVFDGKNLSMPKFKEEHNNLFKDKIGSSIKTLTDDELDELANFYQGVAWNLTQK